ncbi:unnamed protein product [Zymoseptoria tritici ST99CH_3D7]|uniref:LysM domain-containing protein n=1 Tax=Zymoseptoria tritici (strain ST99CH_3D7) TaxID=1276538 RepID=A0A1X7RMF6_ZYMT9|nr:unnamed protein product [Zymoseptoria tritici ST99CH_3D7]
MRPLPALFIAVCIAKETCAPITWSDSNIAPSTALPPALRPPSIVGRKDIQAGEVNCRYSATTEDIISSYTCTELATKYGISIDKFFKLNPALAPDCSDIEPKTQYCVAGFIEPVRAYDGRCGPKHNNASCLGMPLGQCCNAQTWMCGDTEADCAPGTCYERPCAGDKVYSTDGTCGADHGDRFCAGVQGDCCNMNGRCGTGEDFCGIDVCQSGNCPPEAGKPRYPDWYYRYLKIKADFEESERLRLAEEEAARGYDSGVAVMVIQGVFK